MIEKDRTYQVLAMLGTLPFIASAVLAVSAFRLGPVDLPSVLAASYGLAIVCFLCGVHWATYLYKGNETPVNLFVVSNIVVVIVWGTFLLLGQTTFTLLTQMLAFAFLLEVDRQLSLTGLISSGYFRVRLHATLIAEVSLAIVAYVQIA